MMHSAQRKRTMGNGNKSNQMPRNYKAFSALIIVSAVLTVDLPPVRAEAAGRVDHDAAGGLWAHNNVLAWGVAPFDVMQRGPEQRAAMLERLGIKNIAFNWRERDVPAFDDQIEALKRHGINLVAWAVYDTEDLGATVDWKDRIMADPGVLVSMSKAAADLTVGETLEIFRRHNVHPQLWLIQLPHIKPAKSPTP
jgi:hypothetical protein